YCNTGPLDRGSHTLAGVVTEGFLDFSASRGNDLRGVLRGGCSWCLCVSRWKESLLAYRRGEIPVESVPKVKIQATHQKVLATVTLEDLREFEFETTDAESSNNLANRGLESVREGGPIR
ncbi:hypothetical protein IE53DRAFT_321385, partial [Violaceomyces palustris]